MSYQSQLNNLMQMATIEQLHMMLTQVSNTNTINSNTIKKEESLGKEVLLLPIVQKVVLAYEDELKTRDLTAKVEKDSSCCKCANYDQQFSMILSILAEQSLAQDKALTQVLNKLEEIHNSTKKLDVWTYPLIKVEEEQEEIQEQEEQVEYQFADAEEELQVIPMKNEIHITLDIEETEVEHPANVVIQTIVLSESEDEAVLADELEEAVLADELEEAVLADELEEAVLADELEEAVLADELEEEELEEEESEEEVISEAEHELKEEEESEEEVFEIEIDDITYFATDEENGILYEVDSEGEVGNQVGIIKDGEPIFS